MLDAGFRITGFEEHREVSWRFVDDAMVPSPDFEGDFLLAEGSERLPLTHPLQAIKEPAH